MLSLPDGGAALYRIFQVPELGLRAVRLAVSSCTIPFSGSRFGPSCGQIGRFFVKMFQMGRLISFYIKFFFQGSRLGSSTAGPAVLYSNFS